MALFNKRELSEASQEILKKSIDFESNIIAQVKRSERRAWVVTFCSLAVTVCLVAAIAYMLPLKEKVPYLVTVDLKRSTSTVSHLRDDVAYTGIYASEALNRSFVARYVQAREGYDWDTINQHDWEFVASMSNEVLRTQGFEIDVASGACVCQELGRSGQAYKGARGMPRHGQARKGVVGCEKRRGAARRL